MVEVPADTPVTTPELFIVATSVLLLLHEPPAVASLNVLVFQIQTLVIPVIGVTVGNGFTVTVAVALLVQPLPLAAVV